MNLWINVKLKIYPSNKSLIKELEVVWEHEHEVIA